MVVRKRRKIRKLRGSRTMGRGSAKKGRGAGERGGRGLSGGHKQKWSAVVKYSPERFGKRGFKPPQARRLRTINLGEVEERLEEFLEQGVAARGEKGFTVDLGKLGIDKVLGGGRIEHALELIAPSFSRLAKEKIERAGGKATEGKGDGT